MKSRKRSYSDEVEFELSLPVHIDCFSCANYQMVSIPLSQFGVNHAHWSIAQPDAFQLEYALENSDSQFKMCAIRGVRDQYDIARIVAFCPECIEKRDDLIQVEKEYE